MVNYLTKEQLLLIHSIVVDETGGAHGVRDHGRLLSIEAAPRQFVFGKELYPTVFLKAAVYAREIISTHPFVDGNKRTGMTASGVFLEQNGHVLTAKEGEIEHYALKIVHNKLDIPPIAVWLKRHTKKAKK